MHYFNFNIGDYASHTRHLSLLEDLAYRRLLDAYYLGEKPLQGEIDLVARAIGMREHEEEVEYVLTLFFESTPDGFINKRADEEIAHYHGKQEQAIRAGKASAQARLSKRSTSVQPTNNQEPITNKHSIGVAKAPKAQRLKIDSLPQEWADFCKKERPDLKPDFIWNQFKDYWVAQGGQKGAKLDWLATWRNWVRNQKHQTIYTQDKPMQRWDATLEGVMAKGRELGILPKPGETEGQYRERVKQG